MKHEALTEEQILESGLFEEGVYDFTITRAIEKMSKANNEMFELTLTIFHTDGKTINIRDWVMPTFPKKFKHLHDACGLLDLYNSKETNAHDLEGKSGKLILKVGEPQTNKDGFEVRYNQVEDYLKKENMVQENNAPKKTGKDILNDDVPF